MAVITRMAERTRAMVVAVTLVALAASMASAQPARTPTDSAGRAVQERGVTPERGDSVSVQLVDVDLRTAVQALGRYLDQSVLFGNVAAGRVTLETPRPIPRADVLRLLRGLVESQNLELHADTAARLYRVQAKESPRPTVDPTSQRPMVGATGQLAPELFVLRLRHARAVDVAATVNALYGRASALGELGAPSAGAGRTLGQELRPPSAGPAPPPQAAPSIAGRVAQLAGETTIIPDPGTNALLIRAGRGDFELIRAAVQEIDVRPLQVLIEVVIAEVRKDRSFDFGVEASVPESNVPGVRGVRASASQKGIGLGDFALKVMRRGTGVDLDAMLRASTARGDARILSRPVVLASNGEEAEIVVGSQRPFVQVQRSLPTDTPSRDQVVQYRDVGTRLTVKPTISADGYVSVAVTQEVNAATSEVQFDAPVISTRTVQTVLLVRDSQTVVLGGLADRQREVLQGGVPLFSSIPLLGGLFGRASRRSTETEFFLFLTPRIIRTDADADSLTAPLERRSGRVQP
jgi:general secretion pathway protein D